MFEYAKYLMTESKYSNCFSGSIEGFVFEWDFHNFAYMVSERLNDVEMKKSAMDLDVGRTIYADSHDFKSVIMFSIFETMYPTISKQDKEIYSKLYEQ